MFVPFVACSHAVCKSVCIHVLFTCTIIHKMSYVHNRLAVLKMMPQLHELTSFALASGTEQRSGGAPPCPDS